MAVETQTRPGPPRSAITERIVPRATTWWQREVDRLSPRRRRALAWSLEHPAAIVVPAAAIVSAAFTVAYGDGDNASFLYAGDHMLGPGFLNTFSDSWLQIGPVYLLLLGVLGHLVGPWAGAEGTAVLLSALMGALLVWLATGTTGRLARYWGRPTLLARWAVGWALALGGSVPLALEWGHPEEPLLGLLLVEVGLLAARRRHAWAGALLGIATGVKLWAATGLGALLVPRRLRDVITAGAAAAAVTAATYLPFVLFGDFRTTQHVWDFGTSSLFGWLAARTGASEWAVRALEGLVVGAGGALVARRRWSSPAVLALFVVTLRLLLDPAPRPYFVCPAIAVALVWAWTSPSRGARRARVLVTVLSPLPVQLRAVLTPTQTWAAALTLVTVATVYAVAAEVAHARTIARAAAVVADDDATAAATTLAG